MMKSTNLLFTNSLLCLSLLILSSCTNSSIATSEIDTPFPTLTPSITPSPSITPTASIALSPTAIAFNFPQWMMDSDTAILAALIRDDLKKLRDISFFNAATGEKFDLKTPIAFGGFFWYDNMNFGLLSKDLHTAYKINLQTGQVDTENNTPQSTRFLNQDWANGVIMFKPSSSNEVIFDDVRATNKSLNKSFTAEWDNEDKAITVTDTNTNQVIWEYVLPENRYGTEFMWSQVNESYLAFLQGSPEPLNGFITEAMTLTVVDVVKGEVLSTYDGDFGILRWSPDGKTILYQNPWFRYRNYGIPFKDAPCILILATGEKKCLRSIPRVVPDGYNLATTGVYDWATDSKSIFFTYVYSLPSRYEILGNLCNYSLMDSHIVCPTRNLEEMHERSVIWYSISPDEQFIHFCYSASSLLNDYADTANDGIIKMDGSGFFSWVGLVQDGGPQTCSIDILWRPLP